jgi:hypothetical protein
MKHLDVRWLVALGLAVATASGDEPKASKPAEVGAESAIDKKPDAAAPAELVKLSETNDVWLDKKRNAVVVDGQVCLRAGQLEMFACPKGTKEHESVVSLNCLAQEVHAGLLAVGAAAGSPVRYDPEYKPATGQIVDVYVLWRDEAGAKQQVRAQQWVRDFKTKQVLRHDWVFAGSGFWKNEATGQEHYKANGGDLICVSNFPTAMLDLPIKSSDENESLMYEASTEQIPAKGTKVRVVLIPRDAKASAAAR